METVTAIEFGWDVRDHGVRACRIAFDELHRLLRNRHPITVGLVGCHHNCCSLVSRIAASGARSEASEVTSASTSALLSSTTPDIGPAASVSQLLDVNVQRGLIAFSIQIGVNDHTVRRTSRCL